MFVLDTNVAEAAFIKRLLVNAQHLFSSLSTDT